MKMVRTLRDWLGWFVMAPGFIVIWLAWPVQARVVGILFDDSGSMGPRINLPAFGAQVLVSALDGRPGRDRLVTTTLKQVLSAFQDSSGAIMLPSAGVNADNVDAWVRQYAHHPVVTAETLAAASQQQAAIDRIATQWTIKPTVGTPYEPVEVMLDRLVRDVGTGESAVLIIITDGEFNQAPELARIRASYTRYKERLAAKNASLRVEFLLIAPSEPRLVDVVSQQKVRSSLLEIFNGDPQKGSHDVTDINELLGALKDVTASVAGSDWRQQGQYITISGNSIAIDSPLSITQITSIATAQDPAAPPSLTTRFANAADTRRLSTAMRDSDTLPSLMGIKLRGTTEQIRFQPALPPGGHLLTYDRAMDQSVSLLFSTGAFTQLTIREADGTPVVPEGNTYLLALGRNYRLDAGLQDETGGVIGAVALAALKSKIDFTALVDLPSGALVIPLSNDLPNNRATGMLKADTPGPATLTAQARLEGFVTSPSRPVSIRILEMAATFRTRFRPSEDCAQCAPGEARVTLGAMGGDHPVGTVEIVPAVAHDGNARIDLSNLAPGFTVIDSSGHPLANGDLLPIRNGQPIELQVRLRIDRSNMPNRRPLRIGIEAASPLQGGQTVTGTVLVSVPEAQLHLTGHAAGDPSVPLSISGGDLLANGLPMDFVLSDALSELSVSDVTVSGGSALLSYHAEVHGFTIHVRPVTGWWCICVLSIWPPHQLITVTWRDPSGLQVANTGAQFDLKLAWPEIFRSCLLILLLALVIVWLMFVLITAASANRFPRGSVAEIVEGRDLPRFVPLRRRNWTLLRSLVPWPLIRPPHERRAIEGIMFEATSGGANILLDRTQSDPRLVQRNETLGDIRRTRPKTRIVKVIWRNELELEAGARVIIRLLRSLRDRQSAERSGRL